MILASDFDKTLYVEDESVLKKNIELIDKFIKSGNIFIIITGRQYSDIKVLLNKYNIKYTYLICEDGAVIFNSNDFSIRSVLIDGDVVEKVIDLFKENNLEYYLDDSYNYTDNVNDCVKIITPNKEIESSKRILDKVRGLDGVDGYISDNWIDIMNDTVNKRDAIKYLLDNDLKDKSNVYVIGDAINDIEMIKEFNGAIMKKHSKELDGLGKEYDSLYMFIEELIND